LISLSYGGPPGHHKNQTLSQISVVGNSIPVSTSVSTFGPDVPLNPGSAWRRRSPLANIPDLWAREQFGLRSASSDIPADGRGKMAMLVDDAYARAKGINAPGSIPHTTVNSQSRQSRTGDRHQ
jgi:hypothetical protein